ncbi:hypothetical protein [Rhodonellum sp.]|uniref:hypothetical protein n=1 Tax=Rhodonellum sp. TaxID=2231180 RepID=UPI0027171D19|nr:hypothetical protein [Rhodonellum sp.]MDO9554547.1 hypothetical protein [Rhodonellum sp.]
MPYVRDNYIKKAQHIREVYLAVKEEDIPDTRIVRQVFPKFHIFISYRQWMNVKNMKVNRSETVDTSQMILFG